MSFIERAFEPIYGKISWNVSKGIGSFLTFEFGEPHLSIVREPIPLSAHRIAGHERFQARRIVTVHGDWHLWIYCCDWRFFLSDVLIGDSESEDKEIEEIAADLNGQALTKVRVTSTSQTIFTFDLGARLETAPNLVDYRSKDKTEQWYLFDPTGNILALRANGRYSYHPSNQVGESAEWLSIEDDPACTAGG